MTHDWAFIASCYAADALEGVAGLLAMLPAIPEQYRDRLLAVDTEVLRLVRDWGEGQ